MYSLLKLPETKLRDPLSRIASRERTPKDLEQKEDKFKQHVLQDILLCRKKECEQDMKCRVNNGVSCLFYPVFSLTIRKGLNSNLWRRRSGSS
jgi:hypothetical protein